MTEPALLDAARLEPGTVCVRVARSWTLRHVPSADDTVRHIDADVGRVADGRALVGRLSQIAEPADGSGSDAAVAAGPTGDVLARLVAPAGGPVRWLRRIGVCHHDLAVPDLAGSASTAWTPGSHTAGRRSGSPMRSRTARRSTSPQPARSAGPRSRSTSGARSSPRTMG